MLSAMANHPSRTLDHRLFYEENIHVPMVVRHSAAINNTINLKKILQYSKKGARRQSIPKFFRKIINKIKIEFKI
ncbi:hypothetical protein BpHYR1_038950 [Brachionus plicatilis]|uniref:Uncharacterized protein n=1 Tax=Brachionus plicatilis TaxID=10195 RepID=A0A3M7PLI7_BRAPC|nr:hypothetical protein BpHYR1_038950 [Brachionus plicatilis]